MKNEKIDILQDEIDKKIKAKDKRKKPKMKVSGRNVIGLKKIITDKK